MLSHKQRRQISSTLASANRTPGHGDAYANLDCTDIWKLCSMRGITTFVSLSRQKTMKPIAELRAELRMLDADARLHGPYCHRDCLHLGHDRHEDSQE